MANKVRHLLEQDGRYYARVKVPLDLQPLYKAKEIKRKLGTADRREALDRLPVVVALIKDEFRTKRGETLPRFIDNIDPDEITVLIQRAHGAYAAMQSGWNGAPGPDGKPRVRVAPPPPDQFYDFLLKTNRITVSPMAEVLIKRAIPDVLAPRASIPDVAKPFVDQYRAPPEEAACTLRELIAAFENEEARKGNKTETRRNYTTTFDILLETLGETKNIRHIRRRPDIIGIRDIIINLPPRAKNVRVNPQYTSMTYAQIAAQVKALRKAGKRIEVVNGITRNKYLRNIGTLFGYAFTENLIDTNPAQGLTVWFEEDGDDEGKAAFTLDELRLLFPKSYPLTGNGFMPLCALYGSLRPTEVAQLDVADIVLVDDVWCFDITDITKGMEGPERRKYKKVKNTTSIRKVPIHRRLLELGFLDHVERRRKAGHRKVFEVTRIGGWYFASVYDEFRQWMQAAGVKAVEGADGKTFHCFRHNWNTGMIAARTNDNLRKVMGGWTLGKGVDVRTYLSTNNLDMRDLKVEIDKLEFTILIDETGPTA